MKIGIVGCGMIVSLALKAFEYCKDEIEIVALWHQENETDKAKEMFENYNNIHFYTDYDLFLKDSNIEVVYVGVINSAHYDFAKKALLANKSVILEKPFTSCYWQAKELVDLAKQNKLMLIEAVSFLHTPNYRLMKKSVEKLNGIKLVVSNYAQYSSRYNKYLNKEVLPAFSKELCGGSLYDINIYNLNLVLALFGRPNCVNYNANIGFNGIDTSGIASLNYEDKQIVCIGGKDCAGPNTTTIMAGNGYVRLNSAPNVFTNYVENIEKEEKVISDNQYDSHMVYEFKEFNRMFSNKCYEEIYKWLDHSLLVMEIAEKLRKTANIDFPCDR